MRVCKFYSLLLGAALIALTGCSDEKPKQAFETQGLIPPSDICTADPRRFAVARRIADIDEGNGCFVHNAFEVSSMSGVSLNRTSVVNCNVAYTASTWLSRTVQPAAEQAFGERVVGIDVPSAYACRPRNNVEGGKLSEHGMGNAIDISSFELASGRRISVLTDWNGLRDSQAFLRQIRGEACGQFHTVLGPGSDAHHRDHIHLDLQRHRSGGSYCH